MKNAPLTALAAARYWLIALLILFTSQIQSEEINSVRFDIGKSVLPRIVTDSGHDPSGWYLLPHNPRAFSSLGEFSFFEKKKTTSRLVSDDAADRLFGQAGEAQNNGDFQFAVILWERFLDKYAADPQAVKARHYLGVCQMTLKNNAAAIAAFSAVIGDQKADQMPQLEESYYYLGWCQFSLGQTDQSDSQSLAQAIATFDKHLAKFKKGTFRDQAWFLKAEALYFLNRKKESIEAYKKLINDFPKSTSRPNAVYALGVALFEIKQFTEAEKTFDIFVAEFDDSELVNEVQLFKSESVMQRALEANNSEDTEIRTTAKPLFASARDGLKLLAAMETFPKRDEALFNQAICESQLGNRESAANLYVQLTEQIPASPFAESSALSAGKLFFRIKDYPQAEKWLAKATSTNGNNFAQASHWLCRCLLRQKKSAAAAKLATQALTKVKDTDFLVQLKMDQADAIFELPDRKPDTIELYQALAKDHPNHELAPQALYNAAFAAMELKQFEVAQSAAESFLEQYSKDTFVPDVKYVQAECLLLTKKYTQAEQLYLNLIESHPEASDLNAWRVRCGLTKYLQDKYADTITFLVEIVKELKEPQFKSEAQFLLGACEFYQEKFSRSIIHLKQAVEFGDQLKQIDEALILLGQAYASETKFKQAVKILSRILSDHQTSRFVTQANYLSGQYLSNDKSYDQAIKQYSAVLTATPNKYVPFALYGRGWAFLNKKTNQEALDDFSTIIENHSKHKLSADAYYSRGVTNRRLGLNSEAVADLDTCLKENSNFTNRMSALYEKGMALSSLKEYQKAAQTFERLATDFGEDKDADEYTYQLAWSHKLNKQPKKAAVQFRKLTTAFPKSPLAAESHYHVAEDLYQAGKFDEAAKEYVLAVQKSKTPEIGEKSWYKLGWSYYQQKKYPEAQEKFIQQLAEFQGGEYVESAQFMVAECYYQQNNFKLAYAEFSKIKEAVVASSKTNAAEKALTCFHGAESANRIREFEAALKFGETLQNDLKEKMYAADTWLEMGNAHRGLKKFTAAISAFENATEKDPNGATGARAGFLMGEVLFQEKKFKEAINQYKLIIYGFGGKRAPEQIKKWQCSSGYETARCHHVQIKTETDQKKRKLLIDEAIKFYNYVIENHSSDRLAAESKKQIAVLKKL